MMMMMTGRVLLVCALCVLWCGTAGAAADGSEERADLSGIGGGSLPELKEIGKSPEEPQGKKDEAGDVKGKKHPASSEDEEEDDADGDEEDYDVVDDDDDVEEEEREEETVETAETEIPNDPTKEEASSPPQSKHEKGPAAAPAEGIPTTQSPATPVQPTTQGQPPTAAPSPEDSPVPAALAATVTPAVTPSEQGNTPAAARKKDEKQSEDIDPAQESEQPDPQDVVLVQHSQGVHESKESNNNPRNPASASATANQRDATFNGRGEPAQTTSSTKSGFESNDDNSGTEEGISSDDPTADGAGKNDTKNSQNKHGNTKETPVEATAVKATTATTGESDGSTAVSHTTSPLLLLVLVACAAAAAVVAA
ncbi:Mucin-associated surface protein (MASP) [Trypanosoma cruzi]|uniref:Mucin-associated surface protein (MASP), putative n=2 Tax=Trypanosoma cruzi TaxID=5693 RepID=Q4E4Z2_TRYCC|nr:mucin-associated surface protein (MASP), putative [Trypanosoma cruzi]EAN99821.1 mucin-associated surface protein (MASP), putative [Trypanosoma cruzi]PWV21340.1 Mucin-associated surface protein (MASP) [Trypanosoma cruzi]|eukprot:XP_821672.1 mucin-associated surface protein (MASP) [Trypanosoma cruzi strain CL Brener]